MADKFLITKESIRQYTDILKEEKMPYTLSVSNYTVKLESDLFNMQFLRSRQSPKCFGALSKLKKDLINFPIPDTNKDTIIYFQHDLKKDFSIDTAYSVDLKSAYSTTMFLRGLLSADTYNYIKALPKPDRLASIGMLASQKEVFTFNNENKITDHEKIINPLENFFYQCAKDTFDIMSVCRKIAGDDYLFSWVDCVYLRRPDCVSRISDYLSEIGFKWTLETLHRFKAVSDNKKITLSFWKEKSDRCTLKPFNLPHKANQAAKQIIEYLLTGKEYDTDTKVHTAGIKNKFLRPEY